MIDRRAIKVFDELADIEQQHEDKIVELCKRNSFLDVRVVTKALESYYPRFLSNIRERANTPDREAVEYYAKVRQ